ncbi:hypothetical protein [Burkholderia sp. PU8-34]
MPVNVSFKYKSPFGFRTGSRKRQVIADVRGVDVDGKPISGQNLVINLSPDGSVPSRLSLTPGQYEVVMRLGYGLYGRAQVRVDEKRGVASPILSNVKVEARLPKVQIHSLEKQKVPTKSVNTEVGEFLHFRPFVSEPASELLSPVATAGRAINIALASDCNLLASLSRTDMTVHELATAYCGTVAGISIGPYKSRPHAAVALTSGELPATFVASNIRRSYLLLVEGDKLSRLSYRVDRDVKSPEKVHLYGISKKGNLARPLLSPEDEALDALLRYQCSGDIRAAKQIASNSRKRLNNLARAPLFSLACAYLMPRWNETDERFLGALDWLDELQNALPDLPDPSIIKAAILVRRAWTGLDANAPLRDRVKREEQALEIVSGSLHKGWPAMRFGLPLLSEVFARLVASIDDDVVHKDEKTYQQLTQAEKLFSWLSGRVDITQAFTSIELW